MEHEKCSWPVNTWTLEIYKVETKIPTQAADRNPEYESLNTDDDFASRTLDNNSHYARN